MTNGDLTGLWSDYGVLMLAGAGLLGLLVLAGLAVWARRSKKPLRPVALAVSMNLALLLNAEGMWEVLTEDVQLPRLFAGLVFAVFEILFLTATSLAAEQYRRTTVYSEGGRVVTPGHPGSMLYVAALIAVLSGVIVASNSVSATEKLLRLAVPVVIFLMWWAALTAAGLKRRRSRFAYSPRRIAERRGWLVPDDEDPDYARMAAERQVQRMVVAHQRASAGRVLRAWGRWRLRRDARSATDGVVAEVVAQLARIGTVMDLLDPAARALEPEVPRTGEAVGDEPQTSVPAWLAAREKAARVRRSKLRRVVLAAHPVVKIRTVQVPREDLRSAQQKELAVRAVKAQHARLSQREISRVTDVPETTVRDWLRAPREPKSAQSVNGRKPELEGADR
jgi:hypothetical protein